MIRAPLTAAVDPNAWTRGHGKLGFQRVTAGSPLPHEKKTSTGRQKVTAYISPHFNDPTMSCLENANPSLEP